MDAYRARLCRHAARRRTQTRRTRSRPQYVFLPARHPNARTAVHPASCRLSSSDTLLPTAFRPTDPFIPTTRTKQILIKKPNVCTLQARRDLTVEAIALFLPVKPFIEIMSRSWSRCIMYNCMCVTQSFVLTLNNPINTLSSVNCRSDNLHLLVTADDLCYIQLYLIIHFYLAVIQRSGGSCLQLSSESVSFTDLRFGQNRNFSTIYLNEGEISHDTRHAATHNICPEARSKLWVWRALTLILPLSMPSLLRHSLRLLVPSEIGHQAPQLQSGREATSCLQTMDAHTCSPKPRVPVKVR